MYTSHVRVLAACLVLAFTVGCGFDTFTAPTPHSSVVTTEETLHGPYQGTFSTPGGSIGDSTAWFQIAPSALLTSTTLSMIVVTSPELIATMGPHGQTFAQPCTISFVKPANYNVSDVYTICLWNETTETWDELGGVDHGSYVSFDITHFSTYSLRLTES
jgi:hypothetical protein